ncbi:Transcription factor GRAS [Macleaya cordata]|uniref:Transcription factor GRAS n=1 Tax=Macleaya cordata TaxID=56857 RepID=A0A200PYP2_MACCD|nr:Transcription factor GRAS [Macleaya cordata]
METSGYPSEHFSFQSSTKNLMDCEVRDLLHEPLFMEEHHECRLEASFNFNTEEPTLTNTIQDCVFYESYIERLLAMEIDDDLIPNPVMFEVDSLLNFDSIQHQDTIMGLEKVAGTELGSEMNQEETENAVLMEDNSHLKGIQEELMEESSITDLLLTGAEAVEAENWPLAFTVIEKLKSRLFYRENGENAFNKLAFFFTQGLQYKSFNAPELLQKPVHRQTDTMSAFQMLQELTPYVKFAHLTANQAILEATRGEMEVQIIDFDVMEGIQWPPLMIDLVLRKGASLRIIAVVEDPQNMGLIQQTGRRLKEFADSIYLPFRFDQMLIEKEEDFEGIEVSKNLIANCMIHQLHMPHRNFSSVKCFLNGVTKLSPKMVILAEEELLNFSKIPSMSFVEFFCEAFHHYTALSDSLINSFCKGYKVGLKLIEEFLGLRILDCLKQFPCGNTEKKFWKDGFSSLKGYKTIPMSSCNISQAKFLVGLFNGGYWVQHEKCRLGLCWKSRPLISASIWVPI